MKPKIAFCFSWQARTLDQTYLFFQKNLFDAAKEQGFDYDVFCAVEDDEDLEKVKLLNPTKVKKIKSSNVEKIIEEKYWNIDDYIENICAWSFPASRFLQQLYKFCESIKIADNKYDIMVRLRFDMFFFNKLNFKNILSKVEDWHTIICNVPYQRMSHIFWINFDEIREISDFYVIWNSSSIKKLKNWFNEFEGHIKFLKPKNINFINKNIFNISNKFIKLLLYINRKLSHRIFPIMPLSLLNSKLKFKTFCPELFYFNFFLNKWLNIERINITRILLRKDIEKSTINLVNKTKYEI